MRIALQLMVAGGLLVIALGQASPARNVGTISGKVWDKDGRAARGAEVRWLIDGATAFAEARGKSNGAVAVVDGTAGFVLKDVPAGKVNVIVSFTAWDGTRQRGQTLTPVEVKAGEVVMLAEDIRLVDVPVPAAAPRDGGVGTSVENGGRGRGR